MADAHYTALAKAPRDVAWDYCKEMGNWGPSIPGYTEHEVLDDVRSTWTFQVDLGPFSRRVVMDITITAWVELERVEFELKGRTEPLEGVGQFTIGEEDGGTRLKFDITVTPKGMMGPMVDAMARPVLPRMIERFCNELVRRIEERA